MLLFYKFMGLFLQYNDNFITISGGLGAIIFNISKVICARLLFNF